jgi:hypothetical protein
MSIQGVDLMKNVLALLGGFIIGAIVNMGLISIGPSIIPPPDGMDQTTPEGLKAGMHLLQPQHYIFPFLGHALGTLVGAFVCAKIAATLKRELALVIGFIFLMGGISMVSMVGGPLWFKIVDLGFAYIPMAILGWIAAGRQR